MVLHLYPLVYLPMTAAFRAADPGQATGQVIHREYYGHDCVVLVTTGDSDQPLRARCPGRSPVQAGDTVLISANGDVTAWPRPDPVRVRPGEGR
jgi:hypothetical protein